MSRVRILALTKYGRLGASSRMRSWQYLAVLRDFGVDITPQILFPDELLEHRYRRGSYGMLAVVKVYVARIYALLGRSRYDAVWIEKEALPWVPLWIEQRLLRDVPYVLDYDDAIFHNYDLNPRPWVRRFFGQRLDGLMAGAALVVAGNQYLAGRARSAGAPWVEVLPTVVDLDRYSIPPRHSSAVTPIATESQPLRVVWIGSPSTTRYLMSIRDALRAVARRRPFVLCLIGSGAVDLPGIEVEMRHWSEATEVADLASCDIGIMPLESSPWELGKCGYKLIQYMACGLPVVASNVGANAEIVRNHVNGLLADTPEEWVDALERLLADAALRVRWGKAGRALVEQHYCLQQTAPALAGFLAKVSRSNAVQESLPA